jgi:hypothetical protein
LEVDGLPFLEVHHVKHLAQKGSDSVGNINVSSIPLACLIDISQIDAALTKPDYAAPLSLVEHPRPVQDHRTATKETHGLQQQAFLRQASNPSMMSSGGLSKSAGIRIFPFNRPGFAPEMSRHEAADPDKACPFSHMAPPPELAKLAEA